MKISVSYLSSDYSPEKTIYLIEQSNADYLHVDLMDGGFVPRKNFTIQSLTKLLKNHELPLDIHLMVFDPLIYIKDLSRLQPEYITFHLESTKDIVKTISEIKKYQIKAGLTLRPDTPLEEIYPYLSFIDLVLIMSVNPGLGGQKFLEESVNRLEKLYEYRQANNLNFQISIDGGINNETIKKVSLVDIAVSGSYICKSKDYTKQIASLKETNQK